MPPFTSFPRKQAYWTRSDWSKPIAKETPIEDSPNTEEVKPKPEISRPSPRFTVFGNNKSKIALINSRTEPEVHIERKTTPHKKVRFDPVFLEQVCLFSESQSPFELKEAYKKTPNFRLVCPHWNSHQRQPILLDKRWFFVKDNQKVKGKVMVRNLALDKSVSVHYSSDRWSTVREVDGVFFGPNPKNVTFDIYEFTMDLENLADRGEMRSRIEFTVRMTAGSRDYYDNNHGRNYILKVIADPLNQTKDVDDEILEDEYPTEEEDEEEKEKHTSFTNALKEYQHAKPLHIKTRNQLFLGTRYDFSQSLSLAKEPLNNSYVPHVTPPTSPSSSPKPTSIDIRSYSYEDILNKYCFYDSKKTVNN
ncbi:putative phosphatase regulatory subunit-domain-containing protein [Sporodiniella umbellata]|nr:putative phosphatase regulatory subunit-domain-containing protein [Sporodiniella umbellata]